MCHVIFVTLLFLMMCFFFFFSSRRRHTRCSRDWSSDVCSSDLPGTARRGTGRCCLWVVTRCGTLGGPAVSFKDRKFGLLTIRRQIAEDIFECSCTCGNLLDVWRSLLSSGVQRDCGMCRRMMVSYWTRPDGKVIAVRRIRRSEEHKA